MKTVRTAGGSVPHCHSSLLYWRRARQRDASAALGAFSMRHTRFVFLIPLAAIGLALAGCGGGGSVGEGDVAQVGDTPITQEQFDKLMERAQKSYKTNNQP